MRKLQGEISNAGQCRSAAMMRACEIVLSFLYDRAILQTRIHLQSFEEDRRHMTA